MLVGGTAGVGAVVLLVAFPDDGMKMGTLAIVAGSLGGALLGAGACGMHGADHAQRHVERYGERYVERYVERYGERIADGAVLLTIDIGKARVHSHMITRRHPEVQYGGEEAAMLALL